MGIITDIREGKQPGKRVNIYVDGRFALVLDIEVSVKEKLKTGIDLTPERIEELGNLDRTSRCYNAALKLLEYRPRSQSELRDRLKRRGFNQDIIEPVITRLSEQGFVNDSTFARFWTENRESFSPRSRYLTTLELRKKGVAEDIIRETVSGIDDEEGAYRIAQKRAGSTHFTGHDDLQKRLGDYLKRRGFNYETIKNTIDKIWKERGVNSP